MTGAVALRARRKRADRRSRLWLVIGSSALAAVVLGMTLTALLGGSSNPVQPKSAFASAPAGTYAVVVRADDAVDIVDAVSAEGGKAYEVARVPHLPGYTSFAAVSPNGRRLAMVVADGGTAANPQASLQVLDIESGSALRGAEAIDQLQQPVWTPDGAGVIVTATETRDSGAATVRFWYAGLDGTTRLLAERGPIAGAYPVGFDPQGRLLAVEIGDRGSVLTRDFAELLVLSTGLTRQWTLNADGSQLAYLEANLDGGLTYTGRVARLDDPKGAISSAQAALVETTGVAWASSSDEPHFGISPGQTGKPGFEVPIDYSADDRFLVVQRWTGASLEHPGSMTLEVRSSAGAVALDQYARFYGWARR